jgi:FecR protein/Putative zinc-finger
MRHDSESLLEAAIDAIHAAEPDATKISASAGRVADRLGIDPTSAINLLARSAIESCADVRHLLGSYRAGTLSDARALVIRAHLRDCGECYRSNAAGTGTTALDWSTPRSARTPTWNLRAFRWAIAPTLALLALTFFLYRAFWQIPPGVRAEVQSIDGTAYRISDAGNAPLSVGDKLNEGDHLRTSGGSHASLRLSDGSTVEVNERSVLAVGARGRNMTVAVDNGAVIVQAAKRTSGHLYVETPDCRVAVTGTVFSVNAGIKGSRVAVLQGTVHVTHAGLDTLMHAGDQVSTNDNLSSEPVEQQIAWSRDLDKYLPLLAQFSTLQHRIDQIPTPQLRYTSDLLARVPANTLLYVSIPNLGNFLSEANNIFHDQLKQSPALQQWWENGSHHNTEELDSLVDKLRQVSEYLGDEVVIVGVQQGGGSESKPGFAIVADLQKSGLSDVLKTSAPAITVFDEASLAVASSTPSSQRVPYALVRQHEVLFSSSVGILKQMNAQLNGGASGFATGDFGKQITAAYGRGAGVILAADLHQMLHISSDLNNDSPAKLNAMQNSGMDGVRYLIAEHRERNGLPENHVNLQFAGTRQGAASWLAGPAPIGSLEFVTPNAAVAVAFLSKDPAAIADDIMKMAQPSGNSGWSDAEAKLQISIRNDIAANLGGDFLLSLDGAVLPTPAWKAVVEVRNSGQLEKTLERLAVAIHNQNNGNQAHGIVIQSSQSDGQVFYSINDVTSGATVAQYVFANGYMIMAPDRAILLKALHAQSSGNSLARSVAFKALLPTDENANYSAIAYQNVGPVLTPLLSHLSGEAAQALTQLAADGRPTAICAWGKDNRIEAASNSHLFGFDLLALEALVHPDGARNKQPGGSVSE